MIQSNQDAHSNKPASMLICQLKSKAKLSINHELPFIHAYLHSPAFSMQRYGPSAKRT